jgi:hypothetical protein
LFSEPVVGWSFTAGRQRGPWTPGDGDPRSNRRDARTDLGIARSSIPAGTMAAFE